MRLDEIVAAADVLRREKITRPERECTVLEVASFNPLETLTPDTPNGKPDGIVFIERHRLVSGFDDNVDVAGQRLADQPTWKSLGFSISSGMAHLH